MRVSTLIAASVLTLAAAKVTKNEKKCSNCPVKGGNKTAAQEKATVANPEAKKEEPNQNNPKAVPSKNGQKKVAATNKDGEKKAAEAKDNGATITAFSTAAVVLVAVLALAAC